MVPLEVPIGVDTTFTYSLVLRFGNGDAGVSRLAILTPWPARLDVDGIEGVDRAAIDAANTYATNDSLIIAFDPPIGADADLLIPFTTRMLAATHNFQGLVFAPESTSPFLVQPLEGVDPDTEREYSLTAVTTDFKLPILADVEAHPKVFTPNSDGINDEVVLGFTLARVKGGRVDIELYDLGGRLVRTLPGQSLDAGLYAPIEGGRRSLPGRWDGRSDSGEIVAGQGCTSTASSSIWTPTMKLSPEWWDWPISGCVWYNQLLVPQLRDSSSLCVLSLSFWSA